MNPKSGLVSILILNLFFVGFAAAQTEGSVIRGNTNLNVNAENVNTMAIGSGNVARTSIGSVKGSVRGNSNITVDVANVSNVVTGRNRKGCINIGTRTDNTECK
jgi:hypothetical protein